MNDPLLEQIKRRLEAVKGQWPEISDKTGIPYFTIRNIVNGKSGNPTIGSLQPLMDYFGIVAAGPVAEALNAAG